jgi:hypothetical protein
MRFEQLKEDMHAWEVLHEDVKSTYPLVKTYESADAYSILGKEVCFWKTVATTANSINYFVNGVISEEYFIIEGYLKNKMVI